MSLTSFLQSNKRIFTLSFFLLFFTTLTFLVIGLYHTTIFTATFGLPYLSDYGVPVTATSLGVGVSQFFNPVFCLIALIGVFLFAAIFFIIIGAEFLALVFLIVYVGAIAILFLFVIMLLNVKELATAARRILVATQRAAQSAGVPLSCSFVAFLSFFFGNLFGIESLLNLDYIGAVIVQVTSYVGRVFHDVMIFAELLYTYYSGLFMEIALLLLTAMVGSIVLASGTVDIESKKAATYLTLIFVIMPVVRKTDSVNGFTIIHAKPLRALPDWLEIDPLTPYVWIYMAVEALPKNAIYEALSEALWILGPTGITAILCLAATYRVMSAIKYSTHTVPSDVCVDKSSEFANWLNNLRAKNKKPWTVDEAYSVFEKAKECRGGSVTWPGYEPAVGLKLLFSNNFVHSRNRSEHMRLVYRNLLDSDHLTSQQAIEALKFMHFSDVVLVIDLSS
jgi:NADH-quinone oxidoreductase subunit J